MEKQNTKLAEKFLSRLDAVKDYNKAAKLYEKYNKLREQMKDDKTEKLKPEVSSLIASAYEGMERIYNIYKGAYDAISNVKQEEKVAYTDNERKAYFDEIAKMFSEIKQMKEKISPEAKPNATS